jgi:hypothetical protein
MAACPREAEGMSDDRNEGECYGPFHPGFICEDCADRIRALGAQAKKQMARAEKAEAERDQQERFKWTANAARDEAVARLAEALERWPSVLARVKEAEAELAALENRVTYYENNGKLELDDHGHSVPYGGFCLKRAAGRDSGDDKDRKREGRVPEAIARAEAEAALAAANETGWNEGYAAGVRDTKLEFKRAAGRDSVAAAKSAARHAETQECGT